VSTPNLEGHKKEKKKSKTPGKPRNYIFSYSDRRRRAQDEKGRTRASLRGKTSGMERAVLEVISRTLLGVRTECQKKRA